MKPESFGVFNSLDRTILDCDRYLGARHQLSPVLAFRAADHPPSPRYTVMDRYKTEAFTSTVLRSEALTLFLELHYLSVVFINLVNWLLARENAPHTDSNHHQINVLCNLP